MVSEAVVRLWRRNGNWDRLLEEGLITQEEAFEHSIGEPAPEPQVNLPSVETKPKKKYEFHFYLDEPFERKLREVALKKYNTSSLQKFIRWVLEHIVEEQALTKSEPVKTEKSNALSGENKLDNGEVF